MVSGVWSEWWGESSVVSAGWSVVSGMMGVVSAGGRGAGGGVCGEGRWEEEARRTKDAAKP